MSNIAKLETILTSVDHVANVKSNIFVSLLWSYAARFCFFKTALLDPESMDVKLSDEPENFWHPMSIEKRVNEISDIISYCAPESNPDLLPNAEQLIEFFTSTNNTIGSGTNQLMEDALVAELVETQDIDENTAMKLLKIDAKERAERMELQRGAIDKSREQLVLELQQILDHPIGGFEISDRDMITILTKIGDKCEQYESTRLLRAVRTRRKRTRLNIAAERKLLIDTMNQADELCSQYEDAVYNAGRDVIDTYDSEHGTQPEVH